MADTKNNTGINNTGDRNSGYGNSGDRNSGYGNKTNRESGIFCSKEGTVRIFNKDSGKTWDEIDHPHFDEFWLNKWIPESDMTEEEKKADPKFFVKQGYLKTYECNDAWKNFWKDTDEENRKKILNLPNFDAAVFEEITGIKVNEKKEISLSGKEVTVTLDGKKYKAVIK